MASTGGMAAGGAGEASGQCQSAAECQERHTQREEKCQDINANEKQWHDGDTDRDYSVDDDSAAGGVQKRPHSPGSRGNKEGVGFREDEGVQYKLVPPEGGWGWMVVLGTFIIVVSLAFSCDPNVGQALFPQEMTSRVPNSASHACRKLVHLSLDRKDFPKSPSCFYLSF